MPQCLQGAQNRISRPCVRLFRPVAFTNDLEDLVRRFSCQGLGARRLLFGWIALAVFVLALVLFEELLRAYKVSLPVQVMRVALCVAMYYVEFLLHRDVSPFSLS